jgi:hypothetical protein
MAQHDQVIDNGPGLAVRTDFNAAIAALFSSSSGTVAPAVTVPGQLWYDTSVVGPPVLKVRDQANTGWVTLMATATTVTLTGSKPQITIDPVSDGAHLRLDKTAGSSSQTSSIQGYTAGAQRWQMDLGNATAEGGASAGSDFALLRYNDAGTLLGTALSIARATGLVTVPAPTGNYGLYHRNGSGATGLTASTWTKINLGTQAFQNGGFSLSGNSIAVPRAGVYRVTWSVSFQTPVSGTGMLIGGFGLNNTLAAQSMVRVYHGAANNITWTVNGSRLISLLATDKIDLLAWAGFASTSVLDTGAETYLSAELVGAT